MIFNTEEVIEQEGESFSGEVPNLQELTKEITSDLVTVDAPMIAHFDLSVGTSDVLLLGDIRGSFALACSRCLNPYHQRFDQPLEQTFPKDLPQIDVGEEIRQAMVLALPLKPLCKENCKGFCPSCGTNLNVNACGCKAPSLGLFDKLKDLKFKK